MPVKKQVVKSVKKTASRVAVQNVKETKMVSFKTAVRNFFTKFFQFSGVATRAEYWWATLFLFVASFVVSFVFGFVMSFAAAVGAQNVLFVAGILAPIVFIISMVLFVPCITLMSRRLHDAGFSAKILWAGLGVWIIDILARTYGSAMFLTLDWLLSMGLGVFLLIVALLPSKIKNNPYRD